MKIPKLKKNQKKINYSILFLVEKMQKSPYKINFGYIVTSNLKFCLTSLKFEPQVHNEFY